VNLSPIEDTMRVDNSLSDFKEALRLTNALKYPKVMKYATK